MENANVFAPPPPILMLLMLLLLSALLLLLPPDFSRGPDAALTRSDPAFTFCVNSLGFSFSMSLAALLSRARALDVVLLLA